MRESSANAGGLEAEVEPEDLKEMVPAWGSGSSEAVGRSSRSPGILAAGGLRGFLVVRPAGNVLGWAISSSGSVFVLPLVREPTRVSESSPRSRKILRASSRRAVRSPL